MLHLFYKVLFSGRAVWVLLATIIEHTQLYYNTASWMCEDTVVSWEKHMACNHLSQDAGG